MDWSDVATWIVAVAAVAALIWTMRRDRGSDVTRALERIEGDLKDMRSDVAGVRQDLHTLGERVARIEGRLDALAPVMAPMRPAAAPAEPAPTPAPVPAA